MRDGLPLIVGRENYSNKMTRLDVNEGFVVTNYGDDGFGLIEPQTLGAELGRQFALRYPCRTLGIYTGVRCRLAEACTEFLRTILTYCALLRRYRSA